MSGARHILVIRFSAMGDVAMTVPVIKALLSQNPDVSITYVSRPAFSDFFNDIPRLNFYKADLDYQYKGITGVLKLYRDLKKNDPFYGIADLHDNLRSKFLRRLLRLSGISCAYINKGREEKKLLTRFPGKVLKPLKATTERYADVFRALGLQVDLDHRLERTPGLLSDDLIAITGPKIRKWIGIAPFAKHKGKIYPIERTEAVIKALSERNVSIFLFGGSLLEEEICGQWQTTYKNVVSTVNKLTMQQELDLISQLDVMLS